MSIIPSEYRRCVNQIAGWAKERDALHESHVLDHTRSREYASYIMEAVTTVRENAEDIYADAKAINQQRAQQEADAVIEDASEAE